MFTDIEWDQLRDVLRSSGMLPYNPPIPCNETDRVNYPGSMWRTWSIVFDRIWGSDPGRRIVFGTQSD